MSTLLYEYRPGALYINLTNRCTCRCSFCARTAGCLRLGPFDLRLEREPSEDELIEALEAFPEQCGRSLGEFREIVFCGYGEPTLRLDVLVALAGHLKQQGARRIRVNTNGHLLLIENREALCKLAEHIDVLSVSLNAPDEETYDRLCSPKYGPGTYRAVKEFIMLAKNLVPEVRATVVDDGTVNLERCYDVAPELGVKLDIR